MDLKALGEFGFLDRVRAWLGDAGSADLIEDVATLDLGSGLSLVASCDALVEDAHFRLTLSSPSDVGAKSVAVALSDLAAAGADPRWILVTLGLPGDTGEEVLHPLYAGIADACRDHGVTVVGGDTTRAAKISISVTALGTVDGEPMRRSTARVGDALAVTGPLGRSACGLNLLLSQDARSVPPDDALACIAAHRRPTPRLEEGRRLRTAGVRCAMDVSDGLASDVRRLCESSGVGAEIDVVPVAPEVHRVAAARSWDEDAIALGGGEDYELLVALRPGDIETAGVPLIPVGRIVDDGVWSLLSGERKPLPAAGWDHFARPELGR